MLPSEIAKSNTEHAHQSAFFQWINFASRYGFATTKLLCEGQITHKLAAVSEEIRMPELMFMHAIPNGGHRHKAEASKLKAEGVRAGVLDTFLPVPGDCLPLTSNHTYAKGLYIEFKAPGHEKRKNGGLSPAQIAFMEHVVVMGYRAAVAYSWQEAANVVMDYYGSDVKFE